MNLNLRCLLKGHHMRPVRAEDKEEDGYLRHHRDKEPEQVPACYIVEECRRCNKERRIYSSVDLAENFFDVPLEWEDYEN